MYIEPLKNWTCTCGVENYWAYDHCYNCGKPRFYKLTQRQACAVARKLNNLETENRGLSAMLAAATLSVAKPHQKQPCGHERRFRVDEIDGCIVCEAQHLNALAERLMRENADLRRQVAEYRGHVRHALDWLEAAKGGLSYNVIFSDIDRAQKELRQALEKATDETD